jgi:hypothetical protein
MNLAETSGYKDGRCSEGTRTESSKKTKSCWATAYTNQVVDVRIRGGSCIASSLAA